VTPATRPSAAISLAARGRLVRFPRRPLVMGIVNINDDSFCGDGTLDPSAALQQAVAMAMAGADIIDAGAESARTNRSAISPQEECDRFLPFMRAYAAWAESVADTPPPVPEQLWPPLLSLNTWRPEVVAAILPEGGDILNDMSALPDDRNARLCAAHGAALLIMHSVGLPKEKHTHVVWPDIMAELVRFFSDRMAAATAAGLPRNAIILDPGIDFAKQQEDNLTILRDCDRLAGLARPILLPVSRKTVIGQTLGIAKPTERDAGTIACLTAGFLRGAHIFRVHNVPAAVAALRTLSGVLPAAPLPS
jgi:dihydropteroate synthase